MPSARNIPHALRVVALWLLSVSVLLGPAGVAGSMGLVSASEICGVSCPCDEAGPDDHAEDQGEHVETDGCDERGADSQRGEPCKDGCSDDCPNCGCCYRGFALAVLPLLGTSSAVGSSSARMLTPIDELASGTGSSVFRPPRS